MTSSTPSTGAPSTGSGLPNDLSGGLVQLADMFAMHGETGIAMDGKSAASMAQSLSLLAELAKLQEAELVQHRALLARPAGSGEQLQ